MSSLNKITLTDKYDVAYMEGKKKKGYRNVDKLITNDTAIEAVIHWKYQENIEFNNQYESILENKHVHKCGYRKTKSKEAEAFRKSTTNENLAR